MNLRSDILHDEFLAAVDRRRRRRRNVTAAVILIPLVAIGLVHLRPTSPGFATVAEPAANPAKVPADDRPPSLTITDDEELLALLADQGPVLVYHADGTQSLILTEPH